MQTKPYSLQAPEDIAKEYGGNKQAIAQAAQSGLVDPTAAVLAGMFIDRMRNAAAQEQAPQQTVAQQVFAPPQPQMPPGGLGATPQAQAMPPMQPPAAPPMQPPATPLAQPPAMMAGGGLADLPVPESMFPDEYAGGGVVAFASGGVPGYSTAGSVDVNDLGSLINLQQGTDPFYGGVGGPSGLSMEDIIAAAQRRRAIPLSEAEQTYLERLKSAPDRAKQAKSDAFNQFLTSTGLRMLQSKAPGLLAAAGESATAATPLLFAGSKEAKDIEEAGLKGMADIGRSQRAEQLAGITAGERMYGEEAGRLSREDQAKFDRESRERIAKMPPDIIRAAEAIRKPGESLDAAITRYTEATNKADRYNAISNRLASANKAFYESTAYSGLSAKLRDAKTDTDRTKIQNQINALQTKYQDDFEISAGDRAFLRSVNSKLAPQKTMTMADVAETARQSGKSEAEVIAAAKKQGYTIQ